MTSRAGRAAFGFTGLPPRRPPYMPAYRMRVVRGGKN
jgi:hypothetical protein